MSEEADLEAVILCGGLGTRLREETEFKPKPMVEIGGRPILWHIMKTYYHYGVRNFVLCLGYKGDVIRDYFLNYPYRNADIVIDYASGAIESLATNSNENWRVVLADTGRDTMTGARIKKVLPYLKNQTFFATYGDGVADINLPQLLTFHRQQQRLATVTAVRPSSRYGEMAIDGGLVQSFREKPQVNDGWINGGYFVFEKQAFDHLGNLDTLALETSVLEQLTNTKQLAVYQHHSFWQCMDTFREMEMLNTMWAKGEAPWHLWQQPHRS